LREAACRRPADRGESDAEKCQDLGLETAVIAANSPAVSSLLPFG
jgi:hypothetical protein